MDWEKDLKARLGGGIRMQADNVMMIPWMKRMVAKYHDRSKIEKKRKKKKAMGKQEKERQKLFAMKGKGQWGNSKSMRGRCCNPIGGLRTNSKRAKSATAGGDHDGPEGSE